jgi:transposase InsO family protein
LDRPFCSEYVRTGDVTPNSCHSPPVSTFPGEHLFNQQVCRLVPMARGFVYLAAVVDWFSRRVLAWRLSITMEMQFCLEAVSEGTT